MANKYYKAGAPLDEWLIGEIEARVLKGNFGYVAASQMRVHVKRFERWMIHGRKVCEGELEPNTPHRELVRDLFLRVKAADAVVHGRVVADIMDPDTPVDVKFKYLKLKYKSDYSNDLLAKPDGSSVTLKLDLSAIIEERLADALMLDQGDDGDSGDS